MVWIDGSTVIVSESSPETPTPTEPFTGEAQVATLVFDGLLTIRRGPATPDPRSGREQMEDAATKYAQPVAPSSKQEQEHD